MNGNTWSWIGGVAAMLGGVAYVSEAVVFAASPGGALQGVVSLVAVLLTAVGLAGFHAFQKESYGRLGRGGFYAAIAGSLAMIGAVAASLLAGGGYLEGAFAGAAFGIGFLVLMVGWILYGAATLQAKALPRWCGVAFIVVGPQALLPTGDYAGVVVAGFLWMALGYALWTRRDAAAGPRGQGDGIGIQWNSGQKSLI